MAPTTTDRESALRASVFDLLHYTTQGMDSALDIAGAIASAVAVVHAAVADFAQQSNRTRPSVLWNRIPEEIKLETARWLPRAELMGVSRDMRSTVISDSPRWTKISLPNRDMDQSERTEFLQTIVPRSGGRVVDLDWQSECLVPSTNPDAARDLILDVLPRVRTLALHPSYFQSGPHTFWTEPTPHLQSLAISDGTPESYIALEPSWPAKDMPRLRYLKLDAASFHAQPLVTPFAGVVHLEATMGADSDGDVWDHIWDWFPHVERLVAHMEILDDFATLPSPPASLRYVTLIGGMYCVSPGRVVRLWEAHRVHTLEIFASDADMDTMRGAVEYLRRCEPGEWSASFVPACCPERDAYYNIILRGARATVVIRSTTAREHRRQLREARASWVLLGRISTLTLSGPAVDAMFRTYPDLPALRTLTVVGTACMLQLARPLRPDLLHAPNLERLIFDATHEGDPFARLHFLPTFVICIGNPRGVRITILLAANLRGLQFGMSTNRLRFEYAPLEPQHDYPCISARAHDD